MTIVEAVPDASATYRLEARGIGSSSTVEVVLTFGPNGPGTLLHYAAQVAKLGGLLKMVPSGLISGAAQKVVADVLANVEKNLAPES
jgi:carbon monoxide dehydrogenase subunit G